MNQGGFPYDTDVDSRIPAVHIPVRREIRHDAILSAPHPFAHPVVFDELPADSRMRAARPDEPVPFVGQLFRARMVQPFDTAVVSKQPVPQLGFRFLVMHVYIPHQAFDDRHPVDGISLHVL